MVLSIANTLSETSAISIYSGTQPTPIDVINNFSSYNTSNTKFLAHYINAKWALTTEGQVITLTVIPAAVIALNSGVAVWGILWAGAASGHTQAALASTTIPNSKFMIVPVGLTNTTGVVLFNDLTFTAGVSKSILAGNMVSTF